MVCVAGVDLKSQVFFLELRYARGSFSVFPALLKLLRETNLISQNIVSHCIVESLCFVDHCQECLCSHVLICNPMYLLILPSFCFPQFQLEKVLRKTQQWSLKLSLEGMEHG